MGAQTEVDAGAFNSQFLAPIRASSLGEPPPGAMVTDTTDAGTAPPPFRPTRSVTGQAPFAGRQVWGYRHEIGILSRHLE
ncbi:hypothetical protein MBTS_13750 [Methylobacterium bullatum]|nr:hypothetical protein [Methylobacterium bullatum]